MKDYEKKINDFSFSYASSFKENNDQRLVRDAVRAGAKSEAAKEFHQQGMHTEENMYLNMQYYMEYCERNGYTTPMDWIKNHKHFK